MGQDANEISSENTELQTDNSDVIDNHEPLGNDDNSETANSAENDDNKEPVNNEDGNEGNAQQGKFNNLDDANKSYSELEKKLGQQSNELGELRKQVEEAAKLKEQIANMQLQEAQNKGFEDVKSYQNHKEIANFVANEYAKHIQECEFPDEMVNLLEEYKKNPTNELLETIESQYSVETLKDVAEKNAIFKGQLQASEQEALKNEVVASARQYLDENVKKYNDDFQNPAFAALYGEAFRAYGCDLQTDKFVQLMHDYAESIIKANGIKTHINNENHSETDEIAGLTMGSNAIKSGNGKSLLQMSEKELDEALDRII